MAQNLEIIILAGGKGKRMRSDLPKPLHKVGGVPTINRILKSAAPLSTKPIVVIGNHSKSIIEATGDKYHYVLQSEQRGTGHAVLMVRDALKEYKFAETIMVLPGDHPLVSAHTLEQLYATHSKNNSLITIGTITVPNFEGDHECFYHYGRVCRDENGKIIAIVELKDATEDEKKIKEVNLSYYCFNTKWLWDNIQNLTDKNAANELYLTDMVHEAVDQNIPVSSYSISDFREGMGFNTPEELARIERLL